MVIGSPFIEVKPLDTVHMAYFLPHVYKIHNTFICSKQVNNPCTNLDKPLGLQDVGAPKLSRISAKEGGKIVSPKHWLPLRLSLYSFLLKAQ